MWHTGQLLPEGWNAQLRHYPEQSLTLIVLSGQHRGAPLGWTVARSLDRIVQGGEVDFPAAVARQGGATGDEYRTSSGEAMDIAGSRYVSDGGEVFAVTRRGERLARLPRGQAAVNFVLGIQGERVNSLTAATSGTARILYGLARDSVVPVTRNLTDDPEERWAPSLRETATWLDSRFRKVRRHEVLHAVPAGFGEYAAVAFARLYYDDTVTVRLYWVDGRFAGMSDAGAFLGETESVPIEPSALPMAPRPGGGWTAHIVGQTEPMVVKVRRDGSCHRLQLWTRWSNRVTVAEEDRPDCTVRSTDSDGGVPLQ